MFMVVGLVNIGYFGFFYLCLNCGFFSSGFSYIVVKCCELGCRVNEVKVCVMCEVVILW